MPARGHQHQVCGSSSRAHTAQEIVCHSSCPTIVHTGNKKQGSMLLQMCPCGAYVSAIAPLLYRFSSASSRAGSSSFIWPPKPDKNCEQCKLLPAKICKVSCGPASRRQRRDSIPQHPGQIRPRLDNKALCSIVRSLACFVKCTCTGPKPEGLQRSQGNPSKLFALAIHTSSLTKHDVVMVSALHGVLLEW